MKLTQYGDYFYLYILFLIFIPAIILNIKGIKLRYYGIVVSTAMIYLIIGRNLGLVLFLVFLVGEITIIYLYLFIRKKTDNKYLYWLFLFASMLPIIITKVAGVTQYASYIGFIGLSYLNFKAIQIIIEIYDGRITKINFITCIYFITFFPTLSSGPIDRWKRFEEDSNRIIEKKVYLNEYLIIGLKKIFIAIIYKFILAYLIDTYWLIKNTYRYYYIK